MQGTQIQALVWELRFPHATGQLSLWATTTESVVLQLRKPRRLEFVLYMEKSLQWETHALQLESSPPSPQVEKARMQQQTRSTAKQKYIN